MSGPPLLRSMMFVPGNDPRLLDSASRSDADALILDLEDSVPSGSQKQAARDTIRAALDQGQFAERTLFVRVNDQESGHLPADVLALAFPGIAGFVYPKCRSVADITYFDDLLTAVEADRGLPPGTFSMVLLIETPAAVLHAEDLCRASPRVVALAFGCEDFIAELCTLHRGDPHTLPDAALRWHFRETFTREIELLRELTLALCGTPTCEADTFIPLALLADYDCFAGREGETRTVRGEA